MAEDQSAPQSPSLPAEGHGTFSDTTDSGAARRIWPGTKSIDMQEGPPLIELSDIDSAFQLTEHLKALHQTYTHPTNTYTTCPINRSTASILATTPPNIDRSLWLYELCRFLVQKVNTILVSLFSDNPSCSASTCPEMRASEWQYLCAVHDPPKSCCAIDYCCHTLDWAANTLTSPKHFPSRLSLGPSDNSAGAQVTRQHQERQLTNIFRRVYRIFAHAWFQHREVFWKVEGATGLYVLFKTVCDVYRLIPEDNYTIPPQAEGSEAESEAVGDASITDTAALDNAPAQILQRMEELNLENEELAPADLGRSATTKRHRSAPSTGSIAISTVIEEVDAEDEDDAPKKSPVPSKENTQVRSNQSKHSTQSSIVLESSVKSAMMKDAAEKSESTDHEAQETAIDDAGNEEAATKSVGD